ncbi:MAG: OmpA family protein [Myxococcota bacterium]
MLLHRASLAFIGLLGAFWVASCAGPTYPKCDNDSNCADKGEFCVEGSCQQCRGDGDCGDGQQCTAGRCEVKPECATESDCPGNQVCQSGQCKTECTSAADCGGGLKCMNDRCVDENACVTSSDCADGIECSGGVCATNAARSLSTCGYPTVRFAFNEATLDSEARDGLAAIAECINTSGGVLVVEGHCDERGTEEYNLALGDRRARAVTDYLSRLGVPRSRMEVVSKGEAEPLDGGSNEGAWARNRRVEFETP